MGVIIAGSPNVKINGIPVGRVGDATLDSGGGGGISIPSGGVSTGAPGSSASASLSPVDPKNPTAPQELTLTIPQGPVGPAGPPGANGQPGANGSSTPQYVDGGSFADTYVDSPYDVDGGSF